MPEQTSGSGPTGGGGSAGGGRHMGFRCRERRRPESIVVPFWVVQHYGAVLKPFGLAVYLGLCYHLGRGPRAVWPSFTTLAREVGCSRSSVERAIRILKALHLIEIEPHVDQYGQHSNTIWLTEPPDLVNGEDQPPGADGGGAVYMTGGRRPIDGAPPSHRRRPPVAQTARTEGDPSEEIPSEGAPPPCAAPTGKTDPAATLVALWMDLLVCGIPRQRELHRLEIGLEVAELLRRGYPFEQLRTSLLEADRDRTEYARVWRARQAKRRPQQARETPQQAAERLAKVAEEAQRAAESRERAFGAGFSFAERFRRSGKGSAPKSP